MKSGLKHFSASTFWLLICINFGAIWDKFALQIDAETATEDCTIWDEFCENISSKE